MSKRKKPRKKRKPRGRRPDWRPQVKQSEPLEPTVQDLRASTARWPEQMLIEVGRELNQHRQVEALDQDGSRTYDDCVGISYATFEIETCGYRVRAEPRRVGVREVARYAKSSCRRCYGLGYWAVKRRQQAGRDEAGNKIMQDVEFEQSCGCAEKVFKREFASNLLIDSRFGEWIQLDNLDIQPIGAEDGDGRIPAAS